MKQQVLTLLLNQYIILRQVKMEDIKKLWGKDYRPFGEVDPFNKKNFVEGYICIRHSEYYGALIINKVNNEHVTSQLIMGTPKIHYPFTQRGDGKRNYSFHSAKEIEIYEKLDGTNILAFSYTAGGNLFYSYKTRLRPFLGTGRFGNFYSMWNEIAESYFTEIKKIIRTWNVNLSFELYGAKNTHLIKYNNILDFALLFGVTNTGAILSPTRLGLANNDDYSLRLMSLPIVDRIAVIDKDYVWNYEKIQKDKNTELKRDDDGYFVGSEGAVWYLHTVSGRCIQLKCKPDTIEAIHMSAGGKGINKNVIISTCWNAFENMEEPTEEFVKQLLTEEFDQILVNDNSALVSSCLNFVIKENNFKEKVLTEYKNIELNIHLNKTKVMQEMSKHFEKNQMKKVYSTILVYA